MEKPIKRKRMKGRILLLQILSVKLSINLFRPRQIKIIINLLM